MNAPEAGGPRRSASPYLSSLDGDATQSVTVMEWARYLADAFGSEGAVDALRYYEDVNWISEDVRRTMVDYVRGLSLDELATDGDPDVSLDESIRNLEGTPFEKHAKSVEYVAAIGGDSIEYELVPLRLPESDDPAGQASTPGTSTDGVGPAAGGADENAGPPDGGDADDGE